MFLVTAPFSYLETLTETQEQNQFQNHLKKLVDQKIIFQNFRPYGLGHTNWYGMVTTFH